MARLVQSALIITIFVQTFSFPADLNPTPGQSQETLPVPDDSSQDLRAGPPSVKPPSLTTEKPPTTSTEPAAETNGPLGGGKLPDFPGIGGAGGAQQAVRPMLVLGSFQAIITPFDPSVLGSLAGALGGGGGGAGLPTFPPGQGSG